MQRFSLTVDAVGLDATIREVWDKMDVRGELQVRPVDGDRYRLDIIAERDLTPAQLEQISGKRSG